MWLKNRWRTGLLAAAVVLLVSGCTGGISRPGGGGPDGPQTTEQSAGDASGAEAEQGTGDVTGAETGQDSGDAAGKVSGQAVGGAAGAETSAGKQPGSSGGTTQPDGATVRLPRRYDARQHGRTAPVKDQGDLGTCWAFASLLALESALLPEEVYDFSEDHMSHNPNFTLGQEVGGDYTMSMAYLLSWQGPVLEEEDPYGDGISPNDLSPARHVQEIQILPAKDREAIKRAVYTTGGVQSALYTTLQNRESQSEYYDPKTRAYCYPEDTAPNHDVVIVGWDDDFPKENFRTEVPGDGAFLCENSWGPQFGEDGFFYVSYYDGNLGKTNILYASVEDVDNYDHIYQSDLCGWVGQLGYGRDTAWAVNVYTAGESGEELQAVGFYATAQNTEYEVYAVTRVEEDPDRADSRSFAMRRSVAKGSLDYAGFYTIPFAKPVELRAGERFGVMVRLTTPGTVHPIAIEYDAGDGKCRVDITDGEGYISSDGKSWERVEDLQECNLCLKAYTRNR